MADFTAYATPAPGWLEYEAAHPASAPPTDLSHDQRKALYNETRAQAFADFFGPIERVTTADVLIPTSDGSSVEARIYRPQAEGDISLPLYLHLHSGGYYLGNLETEDASCRLNCLETRSVVLNVNYRHTPEWTFPTPMQDVFDALDWILGEENTATYNVDSRSVIVGGVSAGAALACTTALREQDNGKNRINGLILAVPPTVEEEDYPRHLLKDGYSSLEQNAEAPVLPLSRLRFFKGLYKADRSHPYASPLILPDERFKGFPPTCVHIAGLDTLRDEGLLFAQKLKDAGVKTQLEIYPGFPHAFMYIADLKESERWRKKLYEDIAWLRSQSSA